MCSITFFLFLCSEQVCGETRSNGKFKFTFFFFWLFMIESFILLTLSLIEPSARVSENSSLFLCEQGSHFTGSVLPCLI